MDRQLAIEDPNLGLEESRLSGRKKLNSDHARNPDLAMLETHDVNPAGDQILAAWSQNNVYVRIWNGLGGIFIFANLGMTSLLSRQRMQVLLAERELRDFQHSWLHCKA